MGKQTARWIKWGAFGCVGVIFAFLVTFLITTLLTGIGYRRATEARAVLDQRFDTQDEFTPTATIDPDRMERFLEVRRSLQPLCAMVSKHQRLFARFAGLDPQQDRGLTDTLKDVRQTLSVPFLIGRDFGDYVARRNKSLLSNEMGLGEYTWIYVISYHGWLGHTPVKTIATSDRPDVFEQRVNGQVREMIARHVAGGAPTDLEAWIVEAEALAADPTRTAFEDGLPPALEASLHPYRTKMMDLYCPAASGLEVVLTVDTGAWYDHR
jgi:hypothetical protein